MNLQIINAFVAAAAEVLEKEVQLVPKRGTLSIEKATYLAGEITILVSLVGQLEGMVLYGLSLATGKAFVSRIMGQDFHEFDELAQSGIVELGNVITGRSSTRLAQVGWATTISVPILILGKGAKLSTLDIQRLVVPLETECGVLRVDLALRQGSHKPVPAIAVGV